MGQYFIGAILKKNHIKNKLPIKIAVSPTIFGDLYKLLEHSYIGSNYVGYILSLLGDDKYYGYPLVWAGDYADPINNKNYYSLAGLYVRSHKQTNLGFDYYRYIINLSKKQYIDLMDYDDSYIHPIPILTSIGNGEGGNGDYIGTSNANMVGKWAFDCFGVTNDILKLNGFEKVFYEFKE